MKKSIMFFLFATLLIGLGSCSQSSKSQGAKEVAETPEGKNEGKARDIDVVARSTEQLQKLGVTLDDAQQAQLQELAAKYDFSNVNTQEERRAMRQNLQRDIYDNILTPEQRAAIDGMRENRGNKDGN
ncbi:MAG: hypothetical protein KDC66_19595 [Phaeodactylibacter sp.]|nr:hypothetical protein [Phaeodactylibacter sp.]MCB9274878.1 hypothetical protein [Lewinellaceae bacterium]